MSQATRTDREVAADRQVQWLLAEAAGGERPPDLVEHVRRRLLRGEAAGRHGPAEPPARRWFRAACVALGCGVLATALWLGREGARRPSPAGQGPEPPRAQEPAWHEATDAGGLANVPADCRALRAPIGAGLEQQLARLQQLEHLDLFAAGTPQPAGEELFAAIGGLRHLRTLQLRQLQTVDASWLRHLQGLPQLESAQFGWLQVDDDGAEALARVPALQRLALTYDGALTDRGLAYVCGMPGLRTLSLRGCGKLTPAGLTALGRLAQLESLDLTVVNGVGEHTPRRLPAAVMERIEPMVTAEMRLAARPGEGVTDEVLRALAPLRRLRELRVGGCPSVTAAGVAALRELPLATFDLYVPEGPVREHLRALPPTIESLSLAWSSGACDADLELLGGQLPLLAHLDLTRCTAVTDAGLAALLAKLPLQELVLTGCAGLTAESFAALAGAKALRALDVSGLRWVDAEVEDALRSLPGMRDLRCRRGGVMFGPGPR